MIPDELRDLYAFARAEFEAEWRSDFARLRRIPSTAVLRLLDFFADQSPPDQVALADDLALNALGMLIYPRRSDLHAYQAGREVYRRYVDGIITYSGYRYLGTRLLRSFLAGEKTDPQISLPPDVRELAAAIVPTNSREIRKGIKARFKAHFGAKPENLGGGVWRYPGQHGDVALQVEIDYGGLSDQLRYWVTVHDPAREDHLAPDQSGGDVGPAHANKLGHRRGAQPRCVARSAGGIGDLLRGDSRPAAGGIQRRSGMGIERSGRGVSRVHCTL